MYLILLFLAISNLALFIYIRRIAKHLDAIEKNFPIKVGKVIYEGFSKALHGKNAKYQQ
jgi:hypothetical protein